MPLLEELLTGLIQGLPTTAIILIVLIILYYENGKRISEVRVQLDKQMNELRVQLERQISEVRVELEGQINSVRAQLDKLSYELGGRLDALATELKSFRSAMLEYNLALLEVLELKGLLSATEVRALSAALGKLQPPSQSKYYTKEVAERLKQLLEKQPEELTFDEVLELEKIADILIREAAASGRYELATYAGKLLAYAGLVRVKYIHPKFREEERRRRERVQAAQEQQESRSC